MTVKEHISRGQGRGDGFRGRWAGTTFSFASVGQLLTKVATIHTDSV